MPADEAGFYYLQLPGLEKVEGSDFDNVVRPPPSAAGEQGGRRGCGKGYHHPVEMN